MYRQLRVDLVATLPKNKRKLNFEITKQWHFFKSKVIVSEWARVYSLLQALASTDSKLDGTSLNILAIQWWNVLFPSMELCLPNACALKCRWKAGWRNGRQCRTCYKHRISIDALRCIPHHRLERLVFSLTFIHFKPMPSQHPTMQCICESYNTVPI